MAVVATPNKPLVLSKTFSGETGKVEEWLDHFDNVAAVNKWSDDEKLLWLRVHLMGWAQAIKLSSRDLVLLIKEAWAQAVFKRLSTADQRSVDRVKEALKVQFEPASKKDLYLAEFHCRKKKATEGWAYYADNLCALPEKAYSDFSEEAREKLALNNYLQQLSNELIRFAVKQKKPSNLNEAVLAMLEMESYLLGAGDIEREPAGDKQLEITISAFHVSQETLVQAVSELTKRMECLEDHGFKERTKAPTRGSGVWTYERQYHRRLHQGKVVCWKCGQVTIGFSKSLY